MTKILRNSALAIALLGSAALISAPALAGSYKHGHSGWNKNAQHHSYRKNNHGYGRSYGLNTYRRGYGSRGYYYGSPYNYYGSGPGLSITVR